MAKSLAGKTLTVGGDLESGYGSRKFGKIDVDIGMEVGQDVLPSV